MDSSVKNFCDFVTTSAISHNKEALIKECKERFSLIQDGKIYHTDYFAVRFSWSKNKYFSNVVLALSRLQKYDKIPFLVVLASGTEPNKVFLANSTMLNKITHSSHSLTINNIKGSFLGSDIIKKFNELENKPENFEDLFAIHEATEWSENLERLCETTTGIVSTVNKFEPSEEERRIILNSVERAKTFIDSKHFDELKQDLDSRTESCKEALFVASKIENNNIKGRLIEILITSNEEERKKLLQELASVQKKLPVYDTKNALGDYEKTFPTAHAYVDIKVKIIYLNSNPKGFNIDKFLRTMAKEQSVFLLYFVGFDEQGIFNKILCSVYHQPLLDSLIIQKHWAGRGSRGCSQYNGKKIKEMLEEKGFKNIIKIESSLSKIKELLNTKN